MDWHEKRRTTTLRATGQFKNYAINFKHMSLEYM